MFRVYLRLFNVVLHHDWEMPLVRGPPGDGHWSGPFLPSFLKPCQERHKYQLPNLWVLWFPEGERGSCHFPWFLVLSDLQPWGALPVPVAVMSSLPASHPQGTGKGGRAVRKLAHLTDRWAKHRTLKDITLSQGSFLENGQFSHRNFKTWKFC